MFFCQVLVIIDVKPKDLGLPTEAYISVEEVHDVSHLVYEPRRLELLLLGPLGFSPISSQQILYNKRLLISVNSLILCFFPPECLNHQILEMERTIEI